MLDPRAADPSSKSSISKGMQQFYRQAFRDSATGCRGVGVTDAEAARVTAVLLPNNLRLLDRRSGPASSPSHSTRVVDCGIHLHPMKPDPRPAELRPSNPF